MLSDEEAFTEWLQLQRPVLLEEITPDNSWVFLVTWRQVAYLLPFFEWRRSQGKEGAVGDLFS